MSKLAPRRSPAALLTLALVAWLGAVVAAALAGVLRLHGRFAVEPATTQLQRYLAGEPLAGEAEGRVNVLLLGIAADQPGHPLADSILLISLFIEERKATVLSVPRDLSIVFPDGVLRKINEAYDLDGADAAADGSGAKRVLGATLGTPIHYYAALDIDGMKRLIDAIDGVWIDVDRPFEALAKAGYARTVFLAGRTWMNGDRALHFARARYATNGEGSDFARSARQQKLLVAALDRLTSWRTLLDPLALWRLAGALAASLETDLEPWQVAALYRSLAGMNLERMPPTVLRDVLQPGHDAQGTFRLYPRHGTLTTIQHRVRHLTNKPSLADLQASIDRNCGPGALRDMVSAGDLSITPRLVWDRSAVTPIAAPQNARGIVIHHDGIAHPADRSGADKAEALLRTVGASYAWDDVPFHYLIDVDGTVLAGAAETSTTRTTSWDDPSDLLHIALLGDYSEVAPADAQIDSLLRLIGNKAHELSIPASRIHLHSELAATACPGTQTRKRLQSPPWCPVVPRGGQ